MIVRIVQMHFREDTVEAFLALFEERAPRIRGFGGCTHLELWQDAHDAYTFFTYSIWETESHLNHYRFSALFKDTWSRTKALFASRAQAWSVHRKMIMGK